MIPWDNWRSPMKNGNRLCAKYVCVNKNYRYIYIYIYIHNIGAFFEEGKVSHHKSVKDH